MTRDDIIRMTREAGWTSYESQDERFERFAALVAAAEREACAKVCDNIGDAEGHVYDAADAIRARGNV